MSRKIPDPEVGSARPRSHARDAVINLAPAVRLHQAGRLDEAEACYREALRRRPDHVDANYLLGTLDYQRGALSSAQTHLQRAVQANPRHAQAVNNLGLVVGELGRTDEAVGLFQKALAIEPRYADASYNLGNACRQRKDHEAAVVHYRNAIRWQPDFAAAHDNLGLALRDLDRFPEAVASHREAIRLDPQSASAHNNLGAALKSCGDYSAAETAFRAAIAIQPRLAIARSNLGVTLAHLRRFEEAERECREAARIDPTSASAHNNLGLCLFLQGKDTEAIGAFASACRLDAGFADAWNNLGSAYFRSKQWDESIHAYRRSVALRPSVVAHKNLGAVLEQQGDWAGARESFRSAARLRRGDPLLELRAVGVCPTVWNSTDEIEEFRSRLKKELDRCADLSRKRPVAEVMDLDVRPSFHLQFHGQCDRAIREGYARVFRESFPQESPPPRRGGKPAVGFVVAGGHEYAFVRSIGGFFRHFRKDLWRPVLVCPERGVSDLRSRLKRDDIEIVPLPSDVRGMEDRIRSADLDMLYHWEVATGALSYFLPMLRLTPLQCTSWGIQVTSGLGAIDDYVSSRLVEPPTARENYTERLVLLETLLSYQPRMPLPDRPLSRSQLGLPESANLYLCAQQIGKFHPDYDAILGSIVEQDPRGCVVVARSASELDNHRLDVRFRRVLGGLYDRIVWVDRFVGPAYASLVMAADVVLDPTPFGGVNTTYDAFSAGKVVVTMPSNLHRGRYTLGCYRQMNILDAVATSPDEYAALAVRFATQSDFRLEVERKIRESSGRLFEQSASATELEEWMIETIEQDRTRRAR